MVLRHVWLCDASFTDGATNDLFMHLFFIFACAYFMNNLLRMAFSQITHY